MDALLRGDLTHEHTETDKEYNGHMNRFALAMAGGVAIILFGLCLLQLCEALLTSDAAGVSLFLLCVTIAVALFIVAGISHDSFIKEHPHIGELYHRETIRRFDRIFPLLIALPTALIPIGVILMIGLDEIPTPAALSREAWETVIAMIFFGTLTLAVPTYVWAGIQKSKYNIEEYNRNAEKERRQMPSALAERLSGIIMLSATAIFLLLGFCWNLWHPAWVAFPIGGILCGIVSILFPEHKDS